MSLSQDQAVESLKEIDRTSRRSARAYSYAHTGPYLIFWGLIWMVGYGGSDLFPRSSGPLWTALTIGGVLACIGFDQWRASRGFPQPGAGARYLGLRIFASFFAIGMFITATYAIFGHVGLRQQAAFAPLIVALIYSVLGIWRGPRFLVMGILIAALTLGGFFFLKEHFLLWMAAVGGGALVLGGFWLKAV